MSVPFLHNVIPVSPDCGCCIICSDCQNNFPAEVNVLIPALGISDSALLNASGNDDFLYLWEGSDGIYSWQADFGCVNLNFAVAKGDLTYACTADNGPPTTVEINLVSCYPNPLLIIYTFNCLQGGALVVILAE